MSLNTGLSGLYHFTGNANDSSGNGNNATVTGATLTTDKNSVSNQAYLFAGNPDSIDINGTNPFPILSQDFTISLWFNTSSPTGQYMIDNYDGSNVDNRLYIRILNTGIVQFFADVGPSGRLISSVNSFGDGNWHHVCISRISGFARLYIDGVEEGNDNAMIGDVTRSTSTWRIGRQLTTGFNGKIDEVRIYESRGLTAHEVLQLTVGYDTTEDSLETKDFGCIRYYKLDGNTNDATGNFNGTLINAPTSIAGKINNAYQFNGTTQRIECDDSAAYDTQRFSCAFWYRTTTSSSISPTGKWFDGSIRQWLLNFNGSDIRFYIGNNSTFTLNTATVGTQIYDGNWHFVVVTFSGTELKVYFDNVLINTQTTILTMGYNGVKLNIGAVSNNLATHVYFPGDIDEFGYWNRALLDGGVADGITCDEEIAELYNSGSGVQYPFSGPGPGPGPSSKVSIFMSGNGF